MSATRDQMRIDPAEQERRIIDFVRAGLRELGRRGAVIGLSGGLDSTTCAFILKKALGAEKILALILPERDSNPTNIEHAREAAHTLGFKTKEIDITNILEAIGVYELLPKHEAADQKRYETLIRTISRLMGAPSAFTTGFSLLYGEERGITSILAGLFANYLLRFPAFALTKVRVRMIVLHYHALLYNYAVIGTTDKTEWLLGFYDRYGDGANDITLLRHLYKTQIRELAAYVGVPPHICAKPSSADLIAGLPNEVLLGFSYETLDQVLYMLERGDSDHQIQQSVGITRKALASIKKAVAVNRRVQSLPLALS